MPLLWGIPCKGYKDKGSDIRRIKNYAVRKGSNPVNHYIREAIAEYLENHE